MRTTLDLPRDLLTEAMKLTHTGTKTGVIVLALEELIRKSKISAFRSLSDLVVAVTFQFKLISKSPLFVYSNRFQTFTAATSV